MESNWATEHLQAIRTLMERAAVYRRALAPVMLLTGVVGLVAAVAGWFLQIDSPRAFIDCIPPQRLGAQLLRQAVTPTQRQRAQRRARRQQ